MSDTEDWKNQIQRYQLIEFSDTKTLACKLKADMANGEPMHYLCITCADKKKKTTLQPSHISLDCPECKSNIQTRMPPPQKKRQVLSGGELWMS